MLIMTSEDFIEEYKERLIESLMDTDCIVTALLYGGCVGNY